MVRYFSAVFVVAFLCGIFFFLRWGGGGLAKSVYSMTWSVINLDAITGRKAEDSPAGFGEALGSL